MTRERGEWIPWYCEDSPGWVELSFAARGVAEGIARKMGPKRNALHLGHRGLRGLCRLLHGRWEEFEPAMCELLSPGPDGEPPRLVYDAETGTLSDPQHKERRRRSSADRMRDLRDRTRDGCDASDVTPVTDKPCDGGDALSPLLSSDLISSPKGEPERGPSEWFVEVVEAICGDTGERFAVPEAWLRYANHRATKGIRPNPEDARYWLASVMVPEARKERMAASDRKQNQAQRDKRFADHVPKTEPPTAKQSADFAKELARRISEQAKKGAA